MLGHQRLLRPGENGMMLQLSAKPIEKDVKGTKCLKYSLVLEAHISSSLALSLDQVNKILMTVSK